ncbi:hypothetical protein YC2023_017792 [Brassica napus]
MEEVGRGRHGDAFAICKLPFQMDKHLRTKQTKTSPIVASSSSQEVSSIEWEALNMNQEEEDLVCRMHKLVGDRFDPLKMWELIAGRIPGRTAQEIERFWVMKNN